MRVFLAACLLLVSVPAAAQSPSKSGPPLMLSDALAEAFQSNPELIVLRREYSAMQAVPAQEKFLMPPMFETQIWGWPVTTLNPARTDMYMFMGEQEIPGRGKRAARAAVAERDADVAQRRILMRANEILSDVRQAFLDLSLARGTLQVYDRQMPVLHDMTDAATLRYGSGTTGQQDTVHAIGELARLNSDQIIWDERARMAAVQLNTLLGRAPDEPVETAVASLLAVPAAVDLERGALARHPGIAMADAEIAREEAELARIRGERRPDFVVGGGYMLQPGSAGSWTARAGLTWPNAPWSRGRNAAEIETQTRRLEAAKARRDVAIADVRRGIHEAIVRLDSARKRLDLIQTTVLPHAEHEFGIARVNYAGSRGAFADVLESERMLLAADVDRVAAMNDIAKAVADLQRATGELPEVQR